MGFSFSGAGNVGTVVSMQNRWGDRFFFFFFFLRQTVSVLMNLELRLGGEGLSWKTRRGG